MAQSTRSSVDRIKTGLLLGFVVLCVLLIIISTVQAFIDNGQMENTQAILQATPAMTLSPETMPSPAATHTDREPSHQGKGGSN